jgi:hypothetical protein
MGVLSESAKRDTAASARAVKANLRVRLAALAYWLRSTRCLSASVASMMVDNGGRSRIEGWRLASDSRSLTFSLKISAIPAVVIVPTRRVPAEK